mgnify:CR=1 FL=1
MTYNFDVEAWFERERARLEVLKAGGALDEPAFAKALEELESRADAMQSSLDGTFPVGSRDPSRDAPPKEKTCHGDTDETENGL